MKEYNRLAIIELLEVYWLLFVKLLDNERDTVPLMDKTKAIFTNEVGPSNNIYKCDPDIQKHKWFIT